MPASCSWPSTVHHGLVGRLGFLVHILSYTAAAEDSHRGAEDTVTGGRCMSVGVSMCAGINCKRTISRKLFFYIVKRRNLEPDPHFISSCVTRQPEEGFLMCSDVSWANDRADVDGIWMTQPFLSWRFLSDFLTYSHYPSTSNLAHPFGECKLN